jgi:hypothetical protein
MPLSSETRSIPWERLVSDPTVSAVDVIIHDEGDALNPALLGEFLTLFDLSYRAALLAHIRQNLVPLGFSINDLPREQVIPQQSDILAARAADSGEGDLAILRLSKASNLRALFTGTTTALVTAVIISGGQVKCPG